MRQFREELSTLAVSIQQIDTVRPDLKSFTENALIELQQARLDIHSSLTIANNLYHAGLNAMKECE